MTAVLRKEVGFACVGHDDKRAEVPGAGAAIMPSSIVLEWYRWYDN